MGVYMNEEKNELTKRKKRKAKVSGEMERGCNEHTEPAIINMKWCEEFRKEYWCQALTFSNAILCLKFEILSGLHVNQRVVARFVFQTHGKTTNEALLGDMVWASFEVAEVENKMSV